MASAGTVTLELDANSVKLIRELQKAQKQTKTSASSMGKSMKSAMTSMQKQAMASAKAVGLLATAVVASAGAMVRAQSQQIDQLAKTSDALGIQQEKLQALQLMADLTGMSSESLNKNLAIMQRRLGEIARKGGEAQQSLDDIGVPIKDIISLKPDEQLKMLADAIGGVENQAVKASIANDIFGRNGFAMLKMLDQLKREGLDPTTEVLERMGGLLSRVDSARIEQMNDAFRVAQIRSHAFAQQFTVGISTGVTALLTMYSEAESGLNDTSKVVSQNFDKIIFGAIDMAAALGPIFDKVRSLFNSIWNGFTSLPSWAQDIGLVGALLFGKKGLVGLAALSAYTDKISSLLELDDPIKTKGATEELKQINMELRERQKILMGIKGIGSSLKWFSSGSALGFISGETEELERRKGALEMFLATQENLKKEIEDGTIVPLADVSSRTLIEGITPDETDWQQWAREFKERYAQVYEEVDAAAREIKPIQLPPLDEPDIDIDKYKTSAVSAIVSSTRTQVEVLKTQIETIKEAIKSGVTLPFKEMGLTGEEVLDRLGVKLKELEEKGANNFIDLAELGKQAARDIHSGFVNFLMNPFEDGLKGMLKSFLQMMQQIIANVIASRIMTSLFGGQDAAGNVIGGFFNGLFGGGAEVAGTMDSGGMGQAGKAYVINPKAGPEVFIPKTAGEFIPNIDEKMGGGVNLSLTIDARDAGAEARIKDMIVREMVPQIISAAKSDTLNTLRRPRFA